MKLSELHVGQIVAVETYGRDSERLAKIVEIGTYTYETYSGRSIRPTKKTARGVKVAFKSYRDDTFPETVTQQRRVTKTVAGPFGGETVVDEYVDETRATTEWKRPQQVTMTLEEWNARCERKQATEQRKADGREEAEALHDLVKAVLENAEVAAYPNKYTPFGEVKLTYNQLIKIAAHGIGDISRLDK